MRRSLAFRAIDRAIAKSYGPRQLLYVKQKADIQGRMGDHAVGHAGFADQLGEGAGVDAGDADHAAALHPAVEV